MDLCHFLIKKTTKSLITFSLGETIIQQDQKDDCFYLLRMGRLRVLIQNAEGDKETVGYLYPGDHFGEGALLMGQEHRATVRATEDSEVLTVSKDKFFKILKQNPEIKTYLEDHITTIAHRNFTRYLKGDKYQVPNDALQEFFTQLKREEISAGTTIVESGQPAERFYLIGSGELVASKSDESVTLKPGDYFNDASLLTDTPQPFTICSQSNSILFYLDKSDLYKYIGLIPALKPALKTGRKLISSEKEETQLLTSEKQSHPQENTYTNIIKIEESSPSENKSQTPTAFRFPFLKQHDQSDCGAACLGMICKHYKMPIGLNRLRDMTNVSRYGTSMAALAEAAETLGFITRGVRTGYEALMRTELPAILHWEGNHFVVLYHIDKKHVKIADPGIGIRKLAREEFEKGWTNMALLLEYTDQVAENEPTKTSFKRFFPLIKPYTGILIEVFLASVVLSLFGLASPIFMQTIVDQVLVHHDEGLLNLMLIGMVVVALFQMATSTLRTYLIGYVSARLNITMLSHFYRHLLSLPMRFFALRRTGDLTTRFKENATIQRLLTGTTVSAVLDFVMLFIYLGLMFYYNAELTLVMLIFVPLSVGLTLIYTPILKSFSQRAFLARSEQSSVLIDSLRGIDVVKAEAIERTTRWHWEDKFTNEVHIGFRRLKMQMLFGAGGNMINLLSNTVILWYGATLVIAGNLSVGQLMAFNALIGNVMGPILGLIGIWPQVQEARIALDRLNDVYDTPMEKARQSGQGLILKHIEGHLVFDNVFFRYGVGSDEPYVLSNIDLNIESGQKIAIVGRSGAGKTTLVKLVSRLFDPSEGRVTLDGVDVRDFEPNWLRHQVGMVMQDPFLFSGTIAENIAMGQTDVDMDHLIDISKLACVHDFVRDLPLGYDTKVGEQGMGLSGGQNQRIAIARALFHNPKLLIFDEATNALDTESEQAIQANLDLFLKDRTALIIAHRLSTVKDADLIVVLDKGHIVELGHHNELMMQHGLYAHMCGQQLQSV